MKRVASLLEQTLPVDEILVVDDGSEDATLARLATVRDARLRLLTSPQGGVSSARNLAIERARGEWVALLDSDDRWLPEKLAVQMAALAAHPDLKVCHCDEVWIRKGRRVNPRRIHAKRGGRIFEHCLPRCAISPSSVIVHRSLFEHVGMFDPAMPACEDYDLWLRITANHEVLYVDQRLVVKTGGHPDQLSSTVEAQDRYRIRALEKILDAGVLDARQSSAAIGMLQQKINVYRAGVIKRGRDAEAAQLTRLSERFAV